MKKILLFALINLTLIQLQAQGWGQTQKITPDDRALADEFGWSVVVQGDIAAVGAKSVDFNTSDRGAVYMYEKDASNNWIQTQKLFNSDARQFDRFGQSIDIDGDIMIIGARSQDYDENGGGMFYDSGGAAYIFEKDATGNWSEIQKLVSSDRGATFQPLLGETVAISGDYAVVNAPREVKGLTGQPDLTNAGACYIFERDGNGVWSEVQKIVPSQRYAQDQFGDFSLAISGNTIAVGSFRHDFDVNEQNEVLSAGAVYIFERDTNGVWSETQKIEDANREQGEWFGKSVALEGDLLMVGVAQDYFQGNGNAQYGAVHVFERDVTGVYNNIQVITPNAQNFQSRFGHSIDVEGDKMIVGAYLMDIGSVAFGGAAFMFEKDVNGIWNQTAEMYDPNVNSGDDFGYNVAVSGDFAFVGAYDQDEDFEGLNPLAIAGAAYVFDVNEPNTLASLSTLSIVDNIYEFTVKAYPNPTESILNLDFGNYSQGINVSVYTTLGQKVFSAGYTNSRTIQLDIQNQPKGLYLVEVKTESNASSILKVVKH
ncbi:T9SS type A sorting domain-containing protein [Winogradskyella flava]|uniref:T9SS type A sorting domain-containing protein n=1 Tax=Winogradskyella flava TaxID=1884876 RepID=A0A842IQP8_9FLAO|nr:T9SS type A sorting domain-containing protein [Winogradskyella flava]MBC2845532.1 T9SS type A sorting domain-containing protein [Winogradskyella flava]